MKNSSPVHRTAEKHFIPSFLESSPIPYSEFLTLSCHMGLTVNTGTQEGSRNSQVQSLMSLNHLTRGYSCSFSCIVNCSVLGVFHSLKDHLWKYLMSINGPNWPNEPLGQPHLDPPTTPWPGVTSAWSCCSFPEFLWSFWVSCCPSEVAPGSLFAML